jgi:hypothetical protein
MGWTARCPYPRAAALAVIEAEADIQPYAEHVFDHCSDHINEPGWSSR